MLLVYHLLISTPSLPQSFSPSFSSYPILLFHRLDEYKIVNFLTALPSFFLKMLDFEISSES